MATTSSDPVLNALMELGFTELESLVYSFLVGREASTGYRISHAIGKPTANTYKAIASLVQRGAVQVDEGGSRVVRAVPPEELLAGLEHRARERREAARAALEARTSEVSDERVYTLRTREQVVERARAMLGRAREVVLADIFPGPCRLLANDFVSAAARGLRVVIKVYSSESLPGVSMVREPRAAGVLAEWPGQQLSLVTDADEHLLALFDEQVTSVHQAVWSRSTFLSCLQHNHIAMELLHTSGRKRGGSSPEALAEISLLAIRPPGLRRFQQRTRSAPSGPKKGRKK